MNLLLLDASDVREDGTAELQGRAARHVHEVLRAKAGDVLRVGKLGGAVGSAEVLRCEPAAVLLRVTLESPPPPRPGVDVLLAVPRPKVLRRLLASAAALGVDRLVLLNAARVEKSYFSSPVLTPVRTARALTDGLEQAQDTQAPVVHIAERFRPFVEDTLDGFLGPLHASSPRPVGRGLHARGAPPKAAWRWPSAPKGAGSPSSGSFSKCKGLSRCPSGPGR